MLCHVASASADYTGLVLMGARLKALELWQMKPVFP